ncbi:MAG: hypothetical protein HND43_10025 [Armatimonadetes bacterium]|nr:hypothetical protein [Armatimonadota bacterium]NOG39714.1 hypothetical protein [Armatimonadota bacterium]GIK33352.1 MAG: hypothetical protein BroJett009_23440 [Armatimonadota bacterium]
MFILDESYVEARFFMLMSSLGSPCVPSVVQPGQSIPFATTDDFDNWEHDETLIKDRLVGKPSTEAVDILESIKDRFKTSSLLNATREQIASYFG